MAVGLGIIGAGSVAHLHARAAKDVGSRVVAVHDVELGRAKRFADEHGIELATDDLSELTGHDGVDGVVVCVPNVHHRAMAVGVLEAGKHVLLEKPVGMNEQEGEAIRDAVNRTNRRVQVGFVSRYSPVGKVVQGWMDAERVGKVDLVRAQFHRRRGIPGLGGWFTTKKMAGGGVLIDLGVHLIDFILQMTGRPNVQRVLAKTCQRYGGDYSGYYSDEMWAGPVKPDGVMDVEDAAEVVLQMKGGMMVTISLSWADDLPEAARRNGITLSGDLGAIFCDLWDGKLVVGGRDPVTGRPTDEEVVLPKGDLWWESWTAQAAEFQRIVKGEMEPTAPIGQGIEVQRVIDACYASAEAGREVEVGA